VTGGTGDVKPQYLTATTPIPSAGSNYGIIEILVPRLVLGGVNTATVMEILRVDFYLAIRDLSDTNTLHVGFLTTRASRATDETVSLASLARDAADSLNFGFTLWEKELTIEGGLTNIMPNSVVTNDGNGNGILIATDKLFFIAGSFSNAVASESTVKILYRMVNVGITEYVGIVASQN